MLNLYVNQRSHCYEVVELLHVFVEQRNTAEGPVDFRSVERFIICSMDANGPPGPEITVGSFGDFSSSRFSSIGLYRWRWDSQGAENVSIWSVRLYR